MDYVSLSAVPESLHKRIEQFSLSGFMNKEMECDCLSFTKHEPPLRKLGLESIPVDKANELDGSFKTVFQQLLKSSQSTLETFCIEINSDPNFLDHLSLLFRNPVTRSSDPLMSVKSISFCTKARALWLPTVDSFDFNIFPAASHVSITDTDPDYEATEEIDVDTKHPTPTHLAPFTHRRQYHTSSILQASVPQIDKAPE